MRRIIQRTKFRRDYKRQKRRGKNTDKLNTVGAMLSSDEILDITYRTHKLSGKYEGFWECHIESNWLLIYGVTDKEVLLVRTGTHADLFE